MSGIRHLSNKLTALALAALILAACGSPAATPAPAATAPAAAGPRTLQTPFGEIQAPAAPQRVVTLDEGALDVAVALGVQPVGAISSRVIKGVAPYIEAKAGSIPIVGNPGEANLEEVAKLQPDLILTHNRVDQALYNKLSQIAPTYVPTAAINKWQEATRQYASALGREAEAEALLASIQTRVADLKTRLNQPAGATASVVRWMPQGPVVAGPYLSSVQLLGELGFAIPEIAVKLGDAPHTDVLSLENLSQTDTDYIFLATFNAEGDQAVAAAQGQPAFQKLKAAQSKQVIAVSAQLWSSAYGPLATQAMLDDVERSVLATAGSTK